MTDVEAIQNTIAEYCQLYDDRRFDALAEIFVPNATFRVLDLTHRGRENIVRFLEQLSPVRGTHGTFNPVIEVSGDAASVRVDYIWFGVIEGELKVGSGGRYHQRLVKDPDRWRIAELEVKLLLDVGQQASADPP